MLRRFVFAVVAVAAPASLAAQDHAVAGVVVDAGSETPLGGASVALDGGAKTVQTDARGRFLLNNLNGSAVVLRVQRIGYRPVVDTVPVGTTDLRLRLAEAAIALDAIVVTGTAGETRAREVGNALIRTSVATVLQAAPVNTVQEVLQTRAPGVMIMGTQGVVGSGPIVRMRGVSSLVLPNDPLIYVDGVRVDNNTRAGPSIRGGAQVSRLGDLDPEEIESIEVIKGPAAGTLYGTEASRGVIQIFTRRGAEGPPRFALSLRQGANWFANPVDRLPWWFYRKTDGTIDSVSAYQREAEAGRPIFRTGRPQSYEGSLSGGVSNVRYFASAGFSRDEGVVTYDWRNRFSSRVNLSVLPSPKLDIETSIGFVRNRMRLGQPVSNNTEVGWDPMTAITQGGAHLSGTLVGDDLLDSLSRGFARATPEVAATVEDRSAIDRVIGSLQVRHRPFSWFSQRLTLGTDVGDEVSSVFFPSDPSTFPFFGDLSLGDKTVDRRRTGLASLDYSASASYSLGAGAKFTSSAGTQYYDKRVETLEAYGHGFPPGVAVVGGAATTLSSEDVIENRGAGVFVQQQAAWKNRRFLTGAVRIDNNSAFGANFNFATYPKVSASWVLNEESFWSLRFVDGLKLRVAYGIAGRQPDAFSADRTYRPTTGPNSSTILTPQNVGNPDLKPERGTELEAGFDAGLWNDRISATFTYYRQEIRDAITPRAARPSLGFYGNELVNLGRVRNQGIEFSFDARLLERRSVEWEMGASFSTNDSRVVSLGGLPPVQLFSLGTALTGQLALSQYHVEGYPLGSYFMPHILSATLDASGSGTSFQCASGPQPGASAVPCDTVFSVRQSFYAGRPTPSWEGNVRAGLTLFRNLRLRGLVDFRGGNVINYQPANQAHTALNTRASVEKTDSLFLILTAADAAAIPGASVSRSLVRGGFAKLREVSLSYTLPRRLAARLNASSAVITVAARNLAILWQEQKTIFGFRVPDPEVRNSVDLSSTTNNQLPQLASVTTSLRIAF